ncbi:Transcription regulator IclR, N-terminal [uncultured Caudovirales phage]|uniref:Transcription regulator IclR, N-terminal n=1 Tax=uncultured Caudovirales phage TaxID=2100421 RepID=A0A6J5T936_9CAUD|nr:Transcription regulator IclR, N-terminal [uncultured Caudovirales phage]CAB4241253.1 Transcription regulator IclR, N-terminal [uncultured Caudovirales phage]CAB5078989.1 Transcription regulator IclR, N-terminal [uncultured Caudovirales phage]
MEPVNYLRNFENAPVIISAVQAAIEDAGGPITLPQIHAATGIGRGKIARCLNRLTDKGLVRRWRGTRKVTVKHRITGTIFDVVLPLWIYESLKD